jgi:nickel-dependent lactate racemase
MNRIALGYGRTRVEFAYDPQRFDVLTAGSPEERELSDAEILAAIDAPIGAEWLDEVVKPSHRVVVVVPDATRASGSDRISGVLLGKLRAIGVADERIEFLIGAGTHRASTAEEIVRIVGGEVARDVRVTCHDAFSDGQNVRIGMTARGTPVEIDRKLVECDRVILVGAIGFHYFAGFSGGRKALLPACATDRSIQANHLLGFDRATLKRAAGCESGRLDGNPVSEDMEDAARLFGGAWLVNTVLDASNRIVAVYAGDWFAAHRRGCKEYLEAHSVAASEQRPVVVVSVGGAPRDINMIQSHKALEHARVVLEDGGDLVLLAECPDGLGRPDFLDWFAPGSAPAMAARLVEGYKINGQTAWGIRWKAERYRVRLVSALPEEAVLRMGMIPHASLEDAMAATRPGRGWILPNGLATLPVLAERSAARAAAGV